MKDSPMTQDYLRGLAYELGVRGVDRDQAQQVVAEVRSHLAESGEGPAAVFGMPSDYAASYQSTEAQVAGGGRAAFRADDPALWLHLFGAAVALYVTVCGMWHALSMLTSFTKGSLWLLVSWATAGVFVGSACWGGRVASRRGWAPWVLALLGLGAFGTIAGWATSLPGVVRLSRTVVGPAGLHEIQLYLPAFVLGSLVWVLVWALWRRRRAPRLTLRRVTFREG